MAPSRSRVSHLVLALSAVPLVAGGGMFVGLLLALRAIVRRRFEVHAAWMLRAYALGLGARTQVFVFLPA